MAAGRLAAPSSRRRVATALAMLGVVLGWRALWFLTDDAYIALLPEGGLATALWELALASDVGLLVDAASIPVLQAARPLCAHFGIDPLGTIASGALLVAVAADDVEIAA